MTKRAAVLYVDENEDENKAARLLVKGYRLMVNGFPFFAMVSVVDFNNLNDSNVATDTQCLWGYR